MNAAAAGEARRDHGCGRVNAAAIITARKITSGTEIKNQSSFGIRIPPKPKVEHVKAIG
jgi:hypothetical protein